MKKFVSIFLIFVCFVIILSFGACNVSCDHIFRWCVVENASCESDGALEGICSKCGFKNFAVLDKLGHNYTQTILLESTCTTSGLAKIYCEVCNEEKIIDTVKKEHVYGQEDKCISCGIKKNIEYLEEGGVYVSALNSRLFDFSKLSNFIINDIVIDSWGNCTLSYGSSRRNSITFNVEKEAFVSKQSLDDTIVEIVLNDGSLSIGYHDGTVVDVGTIKILDSGEYITRVLLSKLNEFFIILNTNEIIKLGKISTTTQKIDSSVLLYKETADQTGYVVCGMYDTTVETLVIPSTHRGKPVVRIEDNAFEGLGSIKTVVIGDNVREIGSWAFWNCSNLSTINLKRAVQSIDGGAFYGTKLDTVNFEGSLEDRGKINITYGFNEDIKNATWKYNAK